MTISTKRSNRLLNEIFGKPTRSVPVNSGGRPRPAKKPRAVPKGNSTMGRNSGYYDDDQDYEVPESSYCQWSTSDNRVFIPATHTRDTLVPGVYEIKNSPQIGIHFEKIPVKTEGLIRFPDTRSDIVLSEVQRFWERETWFREYGLTYKRGILLYGPPGSGKSCTVQLVMADVVERKGIVLEFGEPYLFIEGMRIIRRIQPDIPIVVVMEDMDSLLDIYDESEILNILDGVNEVDKTIFLGTTNYPDKLGHRITNRPSRFDKRFRIGFPNPESRRIYFQSIIGKGNISKLEINIEKWVEDTDEMSIAHLKELFVAVIILGDDYEEALVTLRSMKEDVKDKDYEESMGFKPASKNEDYYN